MNLEINITKTLKVLFLFNIVLLIANCVGLFFKHYLGYDYVYGLVNLFDFSRESNIPTYYSAVLHLCASSLLAVIAYLNSKNAKPFKIAWTCLALIFLFLSYDEIASVHEAVGEAVEDRMATSSYFYFAWVVPYGIAVLLFVLIYVPFLLSLSKKIRWLFVASGAVFVIGALGFEMLEAVRVEAHGRDDFIYAVLYTIEEFLEMAGISLFIYTLLLYITQEYKKINLSLG